MRALVLLLVVAFISWLLSYAVDCLYSTGGHPRPVRPAQPLLAPGDQPDNLFWFIHLSDIHVTVHQDSSRHTDLKMFVNEVVPLLKPSLVVVTGDLAHSMEARPHLSKQHEKEWQLYAAAIEDVTVPWLDLRGNHDAFNVPSKTHSHNLFRQYASTGSKLHPNYSFKYTHNTSFGQYSFVVVDACADPGPARPYNFFGVLSDDDIAAAEQLFKGTSGHNLTVLLTHYPSNTITADHHKLRGLTSQSTVHLCGHLHTVRDYYWHLYGRHPDGHLELELADWKYSRRYRLFAVDHDLFSFTDVSLNQWPLLLITNPKDAHFIVPHHEPLNRISSSSHIRLLVFSPSPITQVTVSVDGGTPQQASVASSSSPFLYVLPWQPSLYSNGLHTISATAKDAAGNEASVSQSFSVDGTLDGLEWTGEVLLLSNLQSLFRMMFIFLWMLLSVVALSKVMNRRKYEVRVMLPYTVYLLYYGIGPWYVGELMRGVYGLVGAHGLYVSGKFIPGGMTYLHASLEILYFYAPLHYYITSRSSWPSIFSILRHCLVVGSFLVHCFAVYRTGTVYGWPAVVLSPGHGWSLPLAVWLVYSSSAHRRV